MPQPDEAVDKFMLNLERQRDSVFALDEYRCRIIELLGLSTELDQISMLTISIAWNKLMRVEYLCGPGLIQRVKQYAITGVDDSRDHKLTHDYKAALGLVVQALGGPDYGVSAFRFTMKVGCFNTLEVEMDQSLDRRISVGMDTGYKGATASAELAFRNFVAID